MTRDDEAETTDKAKIEIGELDEMIAEAERVLGRSPTIFQMANKVVTLARDEDDRLVVRRLSHAAIKERLCRVATFVRYDARRTEWVSTPPPNDVIKYLASPPELRGFRVIRGIATSPVLRPDGSVVDKRGYDPIVELFYSPDADFGSFDHVPSRDDAAACLADLEDLLVDFPFRDEHHRFAALAALLTLTGRSAFKGCTPLFLVDSNSPGTGKGLCVDVVTTTAIGRIPPRMAPSEDDSEMRKRITTLLRDAETVIVLDNIDGPLGGAALDALITSERWKDRLLGANDSIDVENRMVVVATGNNVAIAGDMLRRTCHVRLETNLANPEERSDFTHPDILGHVREHRVRYVRAALDLLRGYMLAGHPDQKLQPWGSFDGWSRLVRGAIVWAGGQDPAKTRIELRAADGVQEALGALLADLEGWQAARGDTTAGWRVSALLNDVKKHPGELDGIAEGLAVVANGKLEPQTVGMAFKRREGRVIVGPDGVHRMLKFEKLRNANRWRVVANHP